jgi:type 1 glutamine amidotransferase
MNMNVNKKLLLSILTLVLCGSLPQLAGAQDKDPIKILQITGGGPWHDYNTQKDQIKDGLMERLSNIEITTDYEGADTLTMESTDFHFSRHMKKDWAKDFDVVIYNHCNLQVKDEAYVKNIVAEHVKHKVPAVMLHCPMHLYQYAEGDAPQVWWDFVGALSYVHEKENHPNTPSYTIEVLEPENPIMKNYPRSWHTPAGELYLIIDLADGVTPLSHAYSVETGAYVETAWTHEYEGVRVFASTLGHHNESMGSDVNLNLIASGVLWAAGKLEDDGSPASGYDGKRGLGWISLWGDTLNGWLESDTMDWTSATWYGRDGIERMNLSTAYNTRAGESFRIDGDNMVVEGDKRNLCG